MTRTARLKAFAKLNLGLRVLYKRPDGYHELRTVFQTISLADRLDVTYEPAATTKVEIEGTPHIPDNLVGRAAHLVLEAMELRAQVHFDLKKNIPSGAGLGGGSTDAAAVLLALPVLAGKAVPEQKLFEIATRLGSDVPFFLHGGTALGIGRGEELYPLPDQPKARLLLVAPEIHSSTPEAYRDLSAQLTTNSLQNKLFTFQQQLWDRPVGCEGEEMANDFEGVVFARHPALGELRDRLRKAGASVARMTGSGSSLFGIFDDAARLAQARKSFDTERTFALSFVSRRQYRSAWRRALAPHMQSPPIENQPSPLKGSLWPPQNLFAQ